MIKGPIAPLIILLTIFAISVLDRNKMGDKAATTVRFFAGGMHLPAMARLHSGTVFRRISPVLFGKRSPAKVDPWWNLMASSRILPAANSNYLLAKFFISMAGLEVCLCIKKS